MDEGQQNNDVVIQRVYKIGGRDIRTTMDKLLKDLQVFARDAGPDGVVTVAVSAHIPSRRLPSATPDPSG